MNVGVLQTIPIFVSDEIFRLVCVFNISDSIPGCRPYSPFGIYIKLIDGIGTEVISLIVGLTVGGVSGYKIGVRNKAHQKQKARDNATQTQKGNITINNWKGGNK